MKPHWVQIAIAAVLALSTMPASGAAEVGAVDPQAGQVAAILGDMRVERSTGPVALQIGDALYVGDRLRTGAGERAKIVLADDAVIDVGSDTELVIESRQGEAEGDPLGSVLILIAGRVRAMVPSGGEQANRLEIETPAAIAFRGEDFVISYDTGTEISQVIAVDGSVSVAGRFGVVGGVVDVEPGFGTEVRKGRLPSAPQETDGADIDRAVQSTAMLGTGRRDGLEVLHPAMSSRPLSTDDIPRGRGRQAGDGLRVGTPGEVVADRLSADVRTNTQPLLEYKRRNPGSPSATGVEVDF